MQKKTQGEEFKHPSQLGAGELQLNHMPYQVKLLETLPRGSD